MTQLVNHRYFALIDFGLVALCGALLVMWPTAGWWTLILALLPWLLRLFARQFPWQPTPLDGLLCLFLLTAILSAWLSYNPDLAWSKFQLIAASILLYFALSGQPIQNRWTIVAVVLIFGFVVAAHFLLTLNMAGQKVFHPNVAANLMALSVPFILALCLHLWRKRNWLGVGAAIITLLIIGAGLLASKSRGGIAALLVALGVWALWPICTYLSDRLRISAKWLYGGAIVIGGLVASGLVVFVAGGLSELINMLGGPVGWSGRYDLWVAISHLIRDFRFTSGGLASFSGLYSQYILVIPFDFLTHAHNLYLNVTLEQTIFATILLLAIFMQTGWILFQAGQNPEEDNDEDSGWLRWAAVSSMIVMVLHGLIDDPLYGGPGSHLLFMTTGLAMMVTSRTWRGKAAALQKRWLPSVLGVLAGTALVLLLVSRPLSAAWSANRGALAMAHIELADWPTNQWADGSALPDLEPSAILFNKAVATAPTNVTAQYRLGLLAMLAQDYETAVSHLEIAHQAAPNHRGITKNLGYSYTWLGEYAQAAAILADIPEASTEMGAYVSHWQQLGRPDLAQHAAFIAEQ